MAFQVIHLPFNGLREVGCMSLLLFLAQPLFGTEKSALAYTEVSQLLDNLSGEGEKFDWARYRQ